MRTLDLHPISGLCELAQPEGKLDLTFDSPALEFFTDFYSTKPLVIESSVSVLDISTLMKKAHVRMKLVVDKEDHFIGLIGLDDIDEQKIIQKVAQGMKREEIELAELMIPRSELKTLDFEDVKKSTIRDIVETLKESGDQHCLVVDKRKNKIRGVFSSSDISRKLHLPIDIHKKSSFYHISSEIA